MAAHHGLPRQLGFAALSCVLLVVVAPTHAATFTVTARGDDVDAMPGDGTCATLSNVCTLRAAIQEANAAAGVDTINLPRGTYPLTSGELMITDDLVLLGAGPSATVIKNVRHARVMSIASATTVTIDGVRVQRGRADVGAGLLNHGTATLNNVSFTGNRAVNATGSGLGGGIDNTGSVTLSNATFKNNRATGAYGGFGGGIYNTGTVTGTDVAFAGNFTNGCGGAVFNDSSGTLTLTRASMAGNRVTNSGGGVFNQSGTVVLNAATLSRNHAKQSGGGVFTYAAVTLTNVTLNANRAFIGGALVSGVYGAATLANVTISGNRAAQGGGLFSATGSVTLHNTVVAFNQPENCDGSTPVTSLGYNMDSGATCGLATTGDLSNSDPELGPLRNNGGTTKTCALLPGSPAIDAGDNGDCPATDQRGDPRPVGAPAVCDIGAYEVQS